VEEVEEVGKRIVYRTSISNVMVMLHALQGRGVVVVSLSFAVFLSPPPLLFPLRLTWHVDTK
jgi:hypothetical protein